MYGRGNYVPQFGQDLQRPMPPFQQPPAGHPPAPMQFQPGPLRGPPRGPGYPHIPPAPLNSGQTFMQRPLVQGGPPPPRYPFPGSQQNFLSGTLNPPPPLQRPGGYGVLGPRSGLTTQQGVHIMSLPPPPPPPQPHTGFFPLPTFDPVTRQLSAGSHMSLPPQQPPPPPPSSLPMLSVVGESTIKQSLESESSVEVKTDSGREGSLILESQSSVKLSSPPPKPTDETVLRNIEVLCQFIAKNGSQFEEMARKNESGNPKFSFLVGGEPGSEASCAREYYLWMKRKYGLRNDLDNFQEEKNLSQSHSDFNVATVHSPADSDVDMEDDITQTDKEPEVYDSVEDLNSRLVSTGEVSEMPKQETMLLHASDSSSALKSNPPVKLDEEAEMKPKDSSGQLVSNNTPFRLIQNYASDENSDDELPSEQGKARAASFRPKSASPTLCNDNKSGSAIDPRCVHSVTVSVDNVLIEQEALAVQTESLGTFTQGGSSEQHETDGRYGDDPSNLNSTFQRRYAMGSSGIDPTTSKDIEALAVQTESEGTSTKGGYFGKSEPDDKFDGDESNLNPSFQGRYSIGSSGVSTPASADIERKDKMSTSAALKVDEYGRLAKEGISGSESDDTQHVRHRRRNDRSRSRSPSDRKRRRSPLRSPRRSRGRRSRSRSWSPKRRRSRSRSPYRSVGDLGGEKLRRGKAQTQGYLHHDMGKSESSRRYKGRQCHETVISAKNSEFGDSVTSTLPIERDDMKGEKIPYHPNKHDDNDLTSKTFDGNCKEDSIFNGVPKVLHEDVGEDHEDTSHVQGSLGVNKSHRPISPEHLTFEMPSMSQSVHSLSETPQKCDGDNATMVDSGKIDSSAVVTSVISASAISTESFPNQVSNSPQPPLTSQAINAPSVSFPLQTAPFHTAPSYYAPLPGHNSHCPDPTNSGWGILPTSQPRPPHVTDSFISGAPFQHGDIRMRNEFPNPMSLRAQSGELTGHSQVSRFQYQTYHLPSSNGSGTPFSGPSVVRDDRISQFPSNDHGAAGSFAPGVPPQPGQFSGESKVTQLFPGSNVPAGDSSQHALHQFSQQRPPIFGSPLTDAHKMPSQRGGSPSVSSYASEPLVREKSSRIVGGSGIAAHYNPYASTFDQPLSSRFSSAFAQERVSSSGIKYDSSFSLSHGLTEGQTASGYGSRQILSSPNSVRAGEHMPRLGGVQYDPLFDSIEPSSKRAPKEDQAADNSDMLKVGSHKTLDVAENKKQKEVGAVVATTSLENDEYGEMADAEVGVVENGSLSDTDDDAIIAEGEIEIDQIKGGGSDKTGKDSRSMKLFKVAVANFVKEVLKPQWRQGNMSKEVFKTIVKKTVDKVSGSMKNHRLPKSQAKIDHYIDSSRRKLIQLVEGYVSKYKS